MTTGDILFDLVPSPIYRAYDWAKTRPRHIKWWFQRANGKMPDCDAWEYKMTLAKNIQQGLEYLLRDDAHDLSVRKGTQTRKDLEFILQWTKDYEAWENDMSLYNDMEAYRKLKAETNKAFKLLREHFFGLWD